jgi:hypothetical protein
VPCSDPFGMRDPIFFFASKIQSMISNISTMLSRVVACLSDQLHLFYCQHRPEKKEKQLPVLPPLSSALCGKLFHKTHVTAASAIVGGSVTKSHPLPAFQRRGPHGHRPHPRHSLLCHPRRRGNPFFPARSIEAMR